MPKLRYKTIEFDKLKMYFSEPYVIDLPNTKGSITVYQPTIGDIVEIGEKKFYATLNTFIANTTTYRLFLWELGYDWNVLSDFELFMMLIPTIDNDVCKLLFGDVDFKKFDLYEKNDEDLPDNKRMVLYSEEYDIEINEDVYQHFHQYLQNVFAMKPEEKITTNQVMKNWFITKDKRMEKIKEEKGDKDSPTLLNLISSCINHPGFKYNVKELKEVGVCQFYDSVQRLQIYENSVATLRGLFSGLALSGGKGVKPDDYNFMRNI